MKRITAWRHARAAALMLAGIASAHAADSDAPDRRYAYGPIDTWRAPGRHVLAPNTVVRLVRQDGNGSCTVESSEIGGTLPCDALGTVPHTLEQAGQPTLDDGYTRNPRHDAVKAFWLAPSVDRLVLAAEAFEHRYLSPEAYTRQDDGRIDAQAQRPWRFVLPALEAMKTHLAGGIHVAAGDSAPAPFAQWSTLQTLARAADPESPWSGPGESIRQLHGLWGNREVPVALLAQMTLPAVSPSQFRDARALAAPQIGTEAASARFGIPYEAHIIPGPILIPANHYEEAALQGAWDIGEITTRLTRPVFAHALMRDGTITPSETRVDSVHFGGGARDDCPLGFAFGDVDDGGTARGGLHDGALFRFITPEPLPLQSMRMETHFTEFAPEARHGFTRATQYRFDLDGDAVTDLLVWEGFGQSTDPIHAPDHPTAHYRMLFANIGGDWMLMSVDEITYGCGC